MVRWIHAYMSNRLTSVTFDRARSRTVTLRQGATQGSVLLPLLYLFYIDDLASAVRAPLVRILADDVVTVWMQDTDLKRAISKLRKRLDVVISWSTSWKMKLPYKHKSVPSLPQTRIEHYCVQLNISVDNRSSITREQSSLESHTMDSSPLACMRPCRQQNEAASWSVEVPGIDRLEL